MGNEEISMDEWAAAMKGQSETLAALGEEFKNDLRRQGIEVDVVAKVHEEIDIPLDDWAAELEEQVEEDTRLTSILNAIPLTPGPILTLEEIKECVRRADERRANPVFRLEDAIERERARLAELESRVEYHRGYIQGLREGLECAVELAQKKPE